MTTDPQLLQNALALIRRARHPDVSFEDVLQVVAKLEMVLQGSDGSDDENEGMELGD